MRSTSVLTKKPIRSSSAASVRPAIGLPIAMSVPAPSRAQQRGQTRLQHHEQARPGLPRQRRQARGAARRRAAAPHGRRGGSTPPAAAGRPAARAAPAGPASASRPERQLPRQRARAVVLIAQHRLLPQRVVGVLHRQRRQAAPPRPRAAPGTAPPGPAPADRATSRRRRCGAARSSSTCSSSAPSSNRCARSGSSPARSKPRPAAAVSAAASPASLDRADLKPRPRRPRRQDLLPRHPEPVREHGAQALVPLDQIAQRRLQRRAVERARQPHRQRDRVGAADPLQPVQEPQPLLRKGQRDLGRPRLHRHKRRPRRRRLRRQPRAPAPRRSAPRTGCGAPARRPASPGSG